MDLTPAIVPYISAAFVTDEMYGAGESRSM